MACKSAQVLGQFVERASGRTLGTVDAALKTPAESAGSDSQQLIELLGRVLQ